MSFDTKPRFAEGTVHSPINGAILAYLRTYGPCSVEAVDEALLQVDGYHDGDAALTKLRRALHKLSQRRLVHRVRDGGGELWADGPAPARQAPRAGASDAVPPRQYDVMRAPPYSPGRGPAMRPGALDFKAVASHGYRC